MEQRSERSLLRFKLCLFITTEYIQLYVCIICLELFSDVVFQIQQVLVKRYSRLLTYSLQFRRNVEKRCFLLSAISLGSIRGSFGSLSRFIMNES